MQATKSSCLRSAGEAPVSYFKTSCAAMNCEGGRSRICTTRISGRSEPLWPLRTQELQRLAKRSKRIVLVEQNYQGQLGMLIRMDCGLDIPDKILKYDGRPFFYDELLSSVIERCASASENEENVPVFDYAGTSS